MKKGIKRSLLFGEPAEKDRQKQKITCVEQEAEPLAAEPAECIIPPPSPDSFLLKIIKQNDKTESEQKQKSWKRVEKSLAKENLLDEEEDNLEGKAIKWLKSLGWREGQTVGKNSQGREAPLPQLILSNRPQFMGLGAKLEEKKKSHNNNNNNNFENDLVKLPSFEPRIGMVVRDKRASCQGPIMDILPGERAVIIKDFKAGELHQLPLADLYATPPNSPGQQVVVWKNDESYKCGTVHFIDAEMCTVLLEDSAQFTCFQLTECCLLL